MCTPKFFMTDVDCKVNKVRKKHKILVYRPRYRLLSYVNVWLSLHKYKTGKTYAKALLALCKYLAVHDFKDDENQLLEFWRFVDQEILKGWKQHRIIQRQLSRRKDGRRTSSPSNNTIDRQALIVAKFLTWVRFEMGINTLWDGKIKTIEVAARVENGLRGIVSGKYEREVLDIDLHVSTEDILGGEPEPLRAIAKKRQGNPNEFMYDDQVNLLIASFPDPVYAFISLTGYLTGLRNHEALAVPYCLEYDGHVFAADPGYLEGEIRKCPDDKRKGLEITLPVLGKFEKYRQVSFPALGWLEIMRWWYPLYAQRKALYKKRTGDDCPSWILWLTKDGTPIYCKPGEGSSHEEALGMLGDAFDYVSNKRKNNRLKDVFGRSVKYYMMRHTYATNFAVYWIKEMRKNYQTDILSDAALQKALADQLGHDDFDTTLKHYIDNAAAIMMLGGTSEAPRLTFSLESMLGHLAKTKKLKQWKGKIY